MQPNTIGVGWAFPPHTEPNGSIAVSTGAEGVEQAMRIILLTYPGERQMRPEFGSRLRDYVFSPMSRDTASRIETEVRTSLTRWEHRADIEKITVEPAADDGVGVFHIGIRYRLRETDDLRDIVLPFHTLPPESTHEGTAPDGAAATQS